MTYYMRPDAPNARRAHAAVPFDKGHTQSRDPQARMGLSHAGGRTNLIFKRTDKDRRQGTPVTAKLMGDPAPDRLERAEALRQQLVAKTNRFKIDGSDDNVKIRGAYDGRKARSSTPDIPEPFGEYIEPAESLRIIAGRRGDRVLYFCTPRDATRCLTGKDPGASGAYHVKNAVLGVTKSAYGWTWERLAPGRRGRGGGKWSG